MPFSPEDIEVDPFAVTEAKKTDKIPAPGPGPIEFDPFAPANSQGPSEPPKPDPKAMLIQKIDSDPQYMPSVEEFKIWRDTKERQAKENPKSFGDYLDAFGSGVGAVAKGAWATLTSGATSDPISQPASLIEGAFRGTYDMGTMVQKGVINPLAEIFTDSIEPDTTGMSTEERQYQYELYNKYKLERDYGRFKTVREREALRDRAAKGEASIAEENLKGIGLPSVGNFVAANLNQSVAEDSSAVLDIPTVAAMGAGAIASKLALAGKATTAAINAAGKTAEAVGTGVGATARIPERLAGAATKAVTGSDEIAAKVIDKVAKGEMGGAGIAAVTGSVTTPVGAVLTGIEGGKALEALAVPAGKAAQEVASVIAQGPSRLSVLDRVSTSTTAAPWLKRAASAASGIARGAEKAASVAGAMANGAVAGAATGGAIGLALSGGDVESAAGAAGGGSLAGAAGAFAARVHQNKAISEKAADADIANWLAKRPKEDIAIIEKAQLDRGEALKYADIEKLFPELEFNYKDQAGIKKTHPGMESLAGFRDGNRIFINTSMKDRGVPFHEMLHAIEGLDFGKEQLAKINELLFTVKTKDGTVVNRGVFAKTAEDIFLKRYLEKAGDTPVAYELKKLQEQAKNGDEQAANQLTSRVQSEMRAEVFRRSLLEQGPDLIPGLNSLSQRFVDSALLADASSRMGKLKARLNAIGINIGADDSIKGLPYKADGYPTARSPVIDAAIRDYLRSRQRVYGTLMESEGSGLTPHNQIPASYILSDKGGWTAKAYESSDIWQRDTKGNIIKDSAGVPALRTNTEVIDALKSRVDWLDKQFSKIKGTYDAKEFQLREDGRWSGRYFGDAQIQAISNAPDTVIPKSIRDKIVQLNESLKANHANPEFGSSVLMDYNAATEETKGGKRRYANLAPVTRLEVPYELYMSKPKGRKGGNFNLRTLSLTNLNAKVAEWTNKRPALMRLWDGNPQAVLKDVHTVLRNKLKGDPAVLGLHPDATVALAKRNVILDILNFNNDLQEKVSTNKQKDRIIRDRRIDRILSIQPAPQTAPWNIETYYSVKGINKFSGMQAMPSSGSKAEFQAAKEISSARLAKDSMLPRGTWEEVLDKVASDKKSVLAAEEKAHRLGAQLDYEVLKGGTERAAVWLKPLRK